MADHSVGALYELHESELSQSLKVCFGNATYLRNLLLRRRSVLFDSWCLRVALFLHATRKDGDL